MEQLREKIGRIIGNGFAMHDNIFELADQILDLPEIKEALSIRTLSEERARLKLPTPNHTDR